MDHCDVDDDDVIDDFDAGVDVDLDWDWGCCLVLLLLLGVVVTAAAVASEVDFDFDFDLLKDDFIFRGRLVFIVFRLVLIVGVFITGVDGGVNFRMGVDMDTNEDDNDTVGDVVVDDDDDSDDDKLLVGRMGDLSCRESKKRDDKDDDLGVARTGE